MPAGNRSGPNGMGPRTGRGAGFCASNNQPGYMSQGRGFGFNLGRLGRRAFGGRGFRNMFFATGQPGWARYGATPNTYPPAPPAAMTPEQEQESLKAQEAWLQEQLEQVQSQMNKDQE